MTKIKIELQMKGISYFKFQTNKTQKHTKNTQKHTKNTQKTHKKHTKNTQKK
jgi:hypothetical protein